MSRSRSRNSSRNSNPAKTGWPQEERPEHRRFLLRSLERNDVDLAALMECNKSLHVAKKSVLETCGENTLLDLGCGRLVLVNDELLMSSSEGDETALTPSQQAVCRDFLWRRQLRRRLANRLVRRLNRVAHAMDGQDVSPPELPRYGELRLHLDPAQVAEAAKLREQKKEAKERIEAQRKLLLEQETKEAEDANETTEPAPVESASTEKVLPLETTSRNAEQVAPNQEQSEGEKSTEEKVDEEAPKQDSSKEVKDEETPKEESAAEPKDGTDDKVDKEAQEEAAGDAEKGSETKVNEGAAKEASAEEAKESSEKRAEGEEKGEESEKKSPLPVKEEPKVEYIGMTTADDGTAKAKDKEYVEDVEMKEADSGDAKLEGEDMVKEEQEGENSRREEAPNDVKKEPKSILDADTELVREFESAYQQRWVNDTKTYTLLDSNEEEDWTKIKYGGGIGAVNPSLSTKDRELEYIRWKNAILSKIPEQPTLEEVGMENLVYSMESRRKRAMEEAVKEKGEEDDAEENQKRPRKKAKPSKMPEPESEDDSDEQADDDASEDQQQKENESEEDGKEGSSDNGDEKEEDDEEEKQEAKVEEPKRVKAMSLTAVPSFHDQDLRRIKLVHSDLMMASMQSQKAEKFNSAVEEYNSALRFSHDVSRHQRQLEQQIHLLRMKAREQIAQIKNAFGRQFYEDRKRYIMEKREHDYRQAKSIMPSSFGRQPSGTTATMNCMRMGGPVGIIGQTVADIVDGAISLAEGKATKQPFPPFRSNAKNPDDLAKQYAMAEQQLRQKHTGYLERLRASEEKREKAWRKLEKIKAEFQGASYYRGGGYVTGMPSLNHPNTRLVPAANNPAVRQQMASYTPPAARAPVSSSKYSLDRVKERMGKDGSVAPMREPKRTSDGLFQRPAGRTRKGMQWDAVRGIWVPEK